MASSKTDNTFEGSSDKRDNHPQGAKKGRSRRGGRGKTSNKNPVDNVSMASPVHVGNRSTARVQ